MADPRFYDNRGPFSLSSLCSHLGLAVPEGADAESPVVDIATLEGAGPEHLAFCAGKAGAKALANTKAGVCLIGKDAGAVAPPAGTIGLACSSAQHTFAAAINLFYPDNGLQGWSQQTSIAPSARIADNVQIAPGVVIGPDAEVGAGTRIGPNAVIGRGVAIGRNCEIGSNVTLACAYVGDRVTILPGAQIGQPGFGFASSAAGHVKIPQIGRVIIQDRVEIGACCTIDRGAIGDTVIGEGTKIDNLVQVGHNTHIGRHCIVVSQVGISGSCEIEDYVVLGGQAGVADHAVLRAGARFSAKSGVTQGEWAGGMDYGGYPARPVKDWRREMATLALMAKRRRKGGSE